MTNSESPQSLLTKTLFKTGLECPTKLYYLSKKYPSSKNSNEFLQVHADGGHQVGEYAKFVIRAKYPSHKFEDLSSDLDYSSCTDRTNIFLKHENVIIAESAHVVEDFFIRVDLLVKTGNLIEIYEVKSKSISSKDSFFKLKNGITEVKKEWSPSIADVAFQYGIIINFFNELDPPPSSTKVYETNISKEDGYLYYVGRDGHLWRSKSPEDNSPAEKVLDIGIKKKENNLYYFKDSNIYSSQMSSSYDFKAYMMVLDKDKPSNIDKLNQFFLLKKNNNGKIDIELQKLSEADFLSKFKNELTDSIMTIRDVTEIVDLINNPPRNQAGRGDFTDKLKFSFTNIQEPTPLRGFFSIAYYLAWLYKNKRKDSRQAYIDYLTDIDMINTLHLGTAAQAYMKNYPEISRVGNFCKGCEYKVKNDKSGFDECWSEKFPSYNEKKDHIFQLWNYRKSNEFIRLGFHTLSEMETNNYPTMNKNTNVFTRQKLQIQSSNQTIKSHELINGDSLVEKMQEWKYPYHFIDFETCQVALPFHKEQKPFTMLATQYSCHSLYEDGTIIHSDWIAKEDNHDPSFECIEKLYNILDGNDGSIFMYSNYENYVLKSVKDRMKTFDKKKYKNQIEFLESITFSPNDKKPKRALIDLKDIVLKHYYHHSMKGSNSLKAVLPAIMKSSPFLKQKYSKPLTFGKNLQGKIFFEEKNGEIIDPYKLLPKINSNVESSNFFFGEDLLADGAAAMKAFQIIQFSDIITNDEKDNLIEALLNYCELDTLAMVMLYEHIQSLLNKSKNATYTKK